MDKIKKLLELREKIKEKKPDFIRQDYQRRKRLGRKLKWKKPKGIHSKIRHKFKGRRKMPSPGYKSPRKVMGFHSLGLKIVNVSSIDDVNNIKKESEGIVVSKSVGIRKKLEILKKANELQVSVLNLNADEQIKKIQDFINSKKKMKTKETKKESHKESVAKESKKEEKKDVITDDQKKETEKKEKDKLLTKRV